MYECLGWHFPDQETHFPQMLQKSLDRGLPPEYQIAVRQRSLSLCPARDVALDIGANVGLWSRDLCKHFAKVIAFEPVALFRECLVKNVASPNLDVRSQALGSTLTQINMIITANNTGHSHVDPASLGKGSIDMITLDSLALEKVDYVKIDCEGYEYNIIMGGKQTLLRCRPIIVVEDKRHKDVGHNNTEIAVDTLIGWGAKILSRIKDDVILGW